MNRWQALAVRVLAATALALVFMLLPLPRWTPGWVVHVQVPVAVFLLICYLGKLLYDTLFFNRYWP